MARFLAGAAACFLLLTGAFLLWQSRAEQAPACPPRPSRAPVSALLDPAAPLQAPEASPKSREEKRFSRADKNKDGRIESEEMFGARRKAFAKLDANGNGALSFEEWAAKTIDKFQGADKDRIGLADPRRICDHRARRRPSTSRSAGVRVPTLIRDRGGEPCGAWWRGNCRHLGREMQLFCKLRALRRNMTLPEGMLWQALRKRPDGLKFRRQHPIGRCIVDFYCPAIETCRSKSMAKPIRWAIGPSAICRRDAVVARPRPARCFDFNARDVISDLDGRWLPR